MNNWSNISYISLILLCALTAGSVLITGCTSNEASQSTDAPERNVQDIPTNESPSNEASTNDPSASDPPRRELPPLTEIPGKRRTSEERAATPVDIDLTGLSATVLSAEMANMVINGEDYLGKKVRVSGTYYNLFYEVTGDYYHFVITKVGDECCQEGIEFRLTGGHVFPADFPPPRTPIEIDGVYSVYEERERQYYYLASDGIFLLD